MDQLLTNNSTVTTDSSHVPCTIERLLGAGGQGEVYQSQLGTRQVALKWYYPQYLKNDPGLRDRLLKAIQLGAPNDKFLWPVELVSAEGIPGFGYVMPIRDSRYKGLNDLMAGRCDPSFYAISTACIQLADSFLGIHAKGFCYRDISFGNVFFDPATGDVLICDNDNVLENGKTEGGILGTPRFMAPEVVRNEALPSTETDLFSLAVLLFYLLTISHPLEGKKEADIRCLDAPAMKKLYGTEPIFIFDPQNTSNRPVPGIQDNPLAYWPIYPTFLQNLFIRAFTTGMNKADERIRESEWRSAMIKLRDSMLYCNSCGSENFYDGDKLQETGGVLPTCWSCGQTMKLPPRIRIDQAVIMLNHNTRLFPHHLGTAYQFDRPVAEVSRHPTDPNIWGLKNLSNTRWTITTAQGAIKDIEPNKSLTLAVGTKINFGQVTGEIRL